ncbi:hypothetical protein [Streptomyces pinistramenti]|uniref:hypothetical protein n=1 Tax=Streptomyces pinistramenti TaxID=2884812 RepID=UPI001D0862C7|nr:hypothetical protein [Streptomyces pinistramenti]MCB5906144.1 hypothetical protein [Streptomyces pinistramenti]
MRTTDGPPARALRTPRAAGVAGIICAVLLGSIIVLIRNAVPTASAENTRWLASLSNRDTLQLVLNLVPFTGIFFLWVMAFLRDYVGAAEDRFFATLFLGSGLLFVAMLFVLASAADSLLAATDVSQAGSPSRSWRYGRHLTLTMLMSYATRMGAVFTLSTTTIGQRLGIFPRWLAWLGYLVALYLMFAASSVPWSELVFPVWILAISIFVLRANFRRRGVQSSA